MQTVSELNRRFGVAGVAAVVEGNSGLSKVVVTSQVATGEIYLHGSHVTAWAPAGARQVLFCSPNSLFMDGKAIRGGIPVCYPWFGDKSDNPTAPAHGLVRTRAWKLESVEPLGDAIAITTSIASGADTRQWWPFDYRLACRATFGRELRVEMTATNPGNLAYSIEEALHAYFLVGDVETLAVTGLDATRYIDKVDRFTEKLQAGDLHLSAETDRVYLDTTSDVEIIDSAWNRRISIRKHNSRDTVVWNPWTEKSVGMPDLGAGQWKNFVCVETANVGASAVQLAPGSSHTMAVEFHVS